MQPHEWLKIHPRHLFAIQVKVVGPVYPPNGQGIGLPKRSDAPAAGPVDMRFRIRHRA